MDRRIIIVGAVAIAGLATFLSVAYESNTPGAASRVPDPPTPFAGAPAEWDRANDETVRLSPDAFPALPSAIVARLRDLECTIPQTWAEAGPHNVIAGRFIASQDSDWAVLCSRHGTSSILVFPEGAVDSMSELAASPDRDWLQGIGGGRIGFSRLIEVAGPEYIVAYFKAFGGPEPPPLNHDGINDIFVDKASVIRYWQTGHWLELQGSD